MHQVYAVFWRCSYSHIKPSLNGIDVVEGVKTCSFTLIFEPQNDESVVLKYLKVLNFRS